MTDPAAEPAPVSVDAWLRKRRVAVCGATPKRDRFGYIVFRRLLDAGYDVIPVHPTAPHVDQIPCVPRLTEIPGGVDAVSVITPPSASMSVLADAQAIGSPPCWFQPGASSPEVLAEARRLGIAVIDGPCVLVELDRRGGRPRAPRR
jgi:predicted CoA-binding protein